jgi:hypothetical protein
MLQFIPIPLRRNHTTYWLNSLTGSLLASQTDRPFDTSRYPTKLANALNFCNEPYRLASSVGSDSAQIETAKELPGRRVARWTVALSRWNFRLPCLMATFVKARFCNATAAVVAFRSIIPLSQQETLCLPRSLFAAQTSLKFAKSGVVFIGVFLPSRSMHAWIIEDGVQPDRLDSIWLNFRPVAALC